MASMLTRAKYYVGSGEQLHVPEEYALCTLIEMVISSHWLVVPFHGRGYGE